jgi:hypothetical protein
MTTYSALAFCLNCGFRGLVNPVKGEAVHTEKCPNCERNALTSAALRDYAMREDR